MTLESGLRESQATQRLRFILKQPDSSRESDINAENRPDPSDILSQLILSEHPPVN